jgi:molybdopterin synthase catalytic subunit
MSAALLAIVTEPLSVEALSARVQAAAEAIDEGCGALCSFVGVVRSTHQGRRVRYLEYEAFEPLAVKTFQQISEEAAVEWPGTVLGIVHRTGRLAVGEASVVIVAAAAHRAESFVVCRYAIERVKQIAPVWKHEFFDDGQAWVEGAVADPSDPEARRLARTRACA